MIEIIVFFLLVSLALYIIFAGADFGAGILEILCAKKDKEKFRDIVTNAIGPVWESNHIWIILVIVIMFSVFPVVYSAVSITFHIPLVIMLFGIVLRGTAFTFRHYDASKNAPGHLYSSIFASSSLITPFAQGVIAGGMILGIPADPKSFEEAYILPWLNLFPISTGLFLCLLCSLTAAVFLLCEEQAQEFAPVMRRRIRVFSLLTVLCGALVFAAAEMHKFHLMKIYFENFISLLAFVLATVSMILLNFLVSRQIFPNLLRICICAIICFILVGWWHLQFPYLIGVPGSGKELYSIYEFAAPEAVLRQVMIALIIGIALIFPALFFLIRTFKYKKS